MALSISIGPSHSQDSYTSSCATISPAHSTSNNSSNSRMRRSPNFRKNKTKSPRNGNNNNTGCSVMAVLRVVVLAFAMVFLFVCVLQSQHLVIQQQQQQQGGDSSSSSLQRSEWKVHSATSSVTSGMEYFQSQLTRWRDRTHRLQKRQSLQQLKKTYQGQTNQLFMSDKASQTSRLLQSDNSTTTTTTQQQQQQQHRLYVPFWDQQTIFKRRNSWHLMVVILVDDCLPKYSTKNKDNTSNQYPTLATLQDAIQTSHADIVLYFPQPPKSKLFPDITEKARVQQQQCQAKLQAMVHALYKEPLQNGQLQLLEGVINPLPPRIAYEYHHHVPHALAQLVDTMKLPPEQLPAAQAKVKHRLQLQQLQAELTYSLGLEFAYIAELVYEYGDLLFFLKAGTRFNPHMRDASLHIDYGRQLVQQYEQFQQRKDSDHLVHRFCYMSFLQQDELHQLPGPNSTTAQQPRFQASLGALPTGILLEQHGLYRLSMVLRSLLPYHKQSTTGLLMQYCDELLWEAQILQPASDALLINDTAIPEPSAFPPALFAIPNNSDSNSTKPPQVSPEAVQKQLQRIQSQQQQQQQQPITTPPWVMVDGRQVGPQRNTRAADLMELPDATTATTTNKKLVTFVVPTSTRPNGIKNQYVTYSLNQLFPLIRRDFVNKTDGTFQANVLLIICGNTQDELDDHQNGLVEYYGPELKEGILEIVATNLDTYPSLHNLPNNYNDEENRLRWRSKQNLDISSSFFAAKGRGEYIMLLEDDTGYRDKFTPTLKALIESDQRGERNRAPKGTGFGPFPDDYNEHTFAQIHFGFGYSGVLIHDDDALVYAVMHYVLMDEKPCDLLYLANYLQGQVLDQKWRWQLKRVLLTHLGSVSSLKGKFQPVWGLKG